MADAIAAGHEPGDGLQRRGGGRYGERGPTGSGHDQPNEFVGVGRLADFYGVDRFRRKRISSLHLENVEPATGSLGIFDHAAYSVLAQFVGDGEPLGRVADPDEIGAPPDTPPAP